jgi:hypothetical protein
MPLSAPAARLSHDRWRLPAPDRWLPLAIVLGLLASVLHAPTPTALSQVRPGASLTVVRGMVAVTRPDGTAIFPAGTGLTLAVGDIVGTLERTRAILTFFSGSEVELGSNTTIVIRRLDRDLLDQANVTVEHLSGSTLIRAPTEDGPNPGVRILGNGTVAVVRAGEIGHGVDPTSNNVTVACVEGAWRCSRDSVTFPNETTFLVGQTSLTVTGAGDLIPLRVARGASIWDALAEGGSLGQQDGTSGPRGNRDAEDDDDKPTQPREPTPTPTPTPIAAVFATPTPPPGAPGAACGAPQRSSGRAGVFDFVHNLGRPSGNVRIDWDSNLAGDRFEIFYENVRIFTTGPVFLPGTGNATVPYSGSSTFAVVRVTTGPGSNVWSYTITCLP